VSLFASRMKKSCWESLLKKWQTKVNM
jgi:hypothetical protein